MDIPISLVMQEFLQFLGIQCIDCSCHTKHEILNFLTFNILSSMFNYWTNQKAQLIGNISERYIEILPPAYLIA